MDGEDWILAARNERHFVIEQGKTIDASPAKSHLQFPPVKKLRAQREF
jgi:hypothetical protein